MAPSPPQTVGRPLRPARDPSPVPPLPGAGGGSLTQRVRELLRRYRQLDPPPATRAEQLREVDRLAREQETGR